MNRPLTVDDITQAVELVQATYTPEEVAAKARPGKLGDAETLDELAVALAYYEHYSDLGTSASMIVTCFPYSIRRFLNRVNKPNTV